MVGPAATAAMAFVRYINRAEVVDRERREAVLRRDP